MAKRRALLFGLLALTFGLTGAYLNYEWLAKQRLSPVTVVENQIESVSVVTAKADLMAGEAIRDLQTTTIEWPRELLPPGALHEVASAVGRIPRRSVLQGEPILQSALLPEGSEGGLSPIISEGHRAVAVKVDEVIGIAGFVQPGARVDVVATIRDRARQGASFSKVILQDVKVLAVDQTLEQGDSGAPDLVNVVTLEVTPHEAQKVAFAAHEGKLQLALRNPGDGKTVRTSSVSASSLRGYTKPAAKVEAAGEKVQVIKGLQVSNKSF